MLIPKLHWNLSILPVKVIKACQDVRVVFSFQKVVSKQDTLEIQLQALVSAINTICETVGFSQLLDIICMMSFEVLKTHQFPLENTQLIQHDDEKGCSTVHRM